MPKRSGGLSWYEILVTARKLIQDGHPLTSENLRKAAGIPEGPFPSPDKNASAWLSKFKKWGYVKKWETLHNKGFKPKIMWKLTKYGKTIKPDGVNRLSQLVDAVHAFAQARGTRKEEAVWRQVLQVLEGL